MSTGAKKTTFVPSSQPLTLVPSSPSPPSPQAIPRPKKFRSISVLIPAIASDPSNLRDESAQIIAEEVAMQNGCELTIDETPFDWATIDGPHPRNHGGIVKCTRCTRDLKKSLENLSSSFHHGGYLDFENPLEAFQRDINYLIDLYE